MSSVITAGRRAVSSGFNSIAELLETGEDAIKGMRSNVIYWKETQQQNDSLRQVRQTVKAAAEINAAIAELDRLNLPASMLAKPLDFTSIFEALASRPAAKTRALPFAD